MSHVLAIDQGTTSTRALLFDQNARPAAFAQRPLRQSYPGDGWVEHDAEDIWADTLAAGRKALAAAPGSVAAIGITNQRETTLLWDRASGVPLHPAIVWQDRRTAARCRDLQAEGAALVAARTGLLIDPYFSATKLAWLLDEIPGARRRAEAGALCFGTVDSFLLFRLTGARVHATDATNAARTLLFDIHRQCWDEDLLRLFRIPPAVLPEVRDNVAPFGSTTLFGGQIAIAGMAGDQQAALIGQGCLEPGMMKSTYGTGCFALLNTGATPAVSAHRLLTTPAYRLGGRTCYALEGSIFVAGAALQWLRDGLGLLPDVARSAALAASVPDAGGVRMVPAFTGLGAPHWLPEARGALFGLTRDTRPAHLVRAALEAVCFQTRDLIEAMASDGGLLPTRLRVDGGMAANDWMLQFLADMLAIPVERPALTETTSLGAACLAAAGAGLCDGPGAFGAGWTLDRRFTPAMSADRRAALYSGWMDAVSRIRIDNSAL